MNKGGYISLLPSTIVNTEQTKKNTLQLSVSRFHSSFDFTKRFFFFDEITLKLVLLFKSQFSSREALSHAILLSNLNFAKYVRAEMKQGIYIQHMSWQTILKSFSSPKIPLLNSCTQPLCLPQPHLYQTIQICPPYSYISLTSMQTKQKKKKNKL